MKIEPLGESGFLKKYLENTKLLIKTLNIKSDITADLINTKIINGYGESAVDKYDKKTWKYYLNVSGEYHSLDTNMIIVSLDTLEEINFNKLNLSHHVATAKAYEFGSRYYYNLVNKYPDQESLIMGILYPVNIDVAIAAENNSILGYPNHLVEPQEISLIKELEGFIKRHAIRWNVQAYGVSDSYYNIAYYSLLYLHLVPKLLNLRLKRCKTNEVHSFHIREYLTSHMGLDKYLDYMTLKQALYFYRNIKYISRNFGNSHQFRTLVDKLLTDVGIEISQYSIRQLSTVDNKYYPNLLAKKTVINSNALDIDDDFIPITQLYNKEKKLAIGNTDYYSNKEEHDTIRFKNSNSSVVKTKDLESRAVDYNNVVPDPLEVVLLRQWIYMSVNNLYDVVVHFKDPKTEEIRTLTALNAFIYYYYITLKSSGFEISETIAIYNTKYRLEVLPDITELLKLVDNSSNDFRKIAEDLLINQPPIVESFSTNIFYNLSYRLYEESLRQWFMISNTEDMYKRGFVANMILRLYGDTYDTISIGNIESWLTTNNLPFYNYNNEQAEALLKNIFSSATGYVVDETKQLKNIQSALLALLTNLSSYNIQIIKEINDFRIIPLNWAAIRCGDIGFIFSGRFFSHHPVGLLDSKFVQQRSHHLELPEFDVKDYTLLVLKYDIPIALNAIQTTSSNTIIAIRFGTIYIDVRYDNYDPIISSDSLIAGLENYYSLTLEQQSTLKSIY